MSDKAIEFDYINMESEIKQRGYLEVTSPNIFLPNSTEPDPDGLGSYEIFGESGSDDRSSRYGWIDLGDVFMQPDIFRKMCLMSNLVRDVAYGDSRAYIDENGELNRLSFEDKPPKGFKYGTGFKFLYRNFDNIVIKDTGSKVRGQRLELLSYLKKSDIFIKRFLVIPAFYRDVDGRNPKKNEINKFYARLLSLAQIIKQQTMMFPDADEPTDAHGKLMDTLLEIYQYFMSTGGTKGTIRKYVLGKATDYAARLVISAPRLDSDTPNEMEVSFDRTGVPLSKVIKIFPLHIVYGVKLVLNEILTSNKFIYILNAEKNIFERKELGDYHEDEFNSDSIQKMINRYDSMKEYRMESFKLPLSDGKMAPILYFRRNKNEIESMDFAEPPTSILNQSSPREMLKDGWRPMTMTDLFYMAAERTVGVNGEDLAIYVTRYPVLSSNSIYPSLMNIIPYYKTSKATVGDIEYPRFPNIEDNKNITPKELDKCFTDSLRLFPTYLDALGGDHDGDQTSIQGVYSKEANENAKKRIYSAANFVGVDGGSIRGIGDVMSHLIYNLTY